MAVDAYQGWPISTTQAAGCIAELVTLDVAQRAIFHNIHAVSLRHLGVADRDIERPVVYQG